MKTKDKKELHTKTKTELVKMIKDLQGDLLKYTLDKSQNKLKNTSSLANARKAIAVMKTILREKELIKNV